MTNEEAFDDFEEGIRRFKEHDRQAQELYDNVKGIVDVVISKAKQSITISGGLRDISEAAKSMSSIRGDAIMATSHAFNARMKVEELKLKKERIDKGDEDVNSTALLMRQLTETIQKQSFEDRKVNRANDVRGIVVSDGSEELKNRLKSEMTTGNLKVNSNETNMKYDFGGVNYRYDDVNSTMVALDSSGNKIEGYNVERIPEQMRFNRVENGVPIDNRGLEIKAYVG